MTTFSKNAKWIWIEAQTDSIHQYGCFRRTFELKAATDGKLLVAVNWDFIAYLNGEEIGRGQFPDYPERKTVTTLDLKHLPAGTHVLSFFVYNSGENFSTSPKAPAGLLVQLDLTEQHLVSDASWKSRLHPAFQSGRMPKVTSQLAFTTQYDARFEENWMAADYDDSRWSFAVVNPHYAPTLSPRPLPPIPLGDRVKGHIVKTGWFTREEKAGSFAEIVSRDVYTFASPEKVIVDGKLSQTPKDFDGAVIIADLGKEWVGFIEIECVAGQGTIVDISHGEHLEDGNVRASVGGRNFTDRLICRDGLTTYHLPFRRIGGRYLQLNFTNISGNVELLFMGLRKWNLLLPEVTPFICDDPHAAQLREVGLHTLELCMHDHYEDCPWREQALYAYDSRNQMLFGYYAWGNYKFVAASLDLLGNGLQSDGHLNLCAPTHRSIVIPIFSYVWISALYEHYLYSGEDALLLKFADSLKAIVDHALAQKDTDTGLVKIRKEEQYWNFCEWVPGLDGSKKEEANAKDPASDALQAPHNLYLFEALTSYIKIMQTVGNRSETERIAPICSALGQSVEKHFWSEEKGCYLTRLSPDSNLHEHVQYLMLTLDLVPEEKKDRVLHALRSGKLTPLTLSPLPYMVNARFKQSAEEQAYAVEAINQIYTAMLSKDATTFWETQDGASAFGNAGSLCHAWSSIHVYYYGAFVLGVRPLTAGFRTFEVKPYAGKLTHAKGAIPTPAGDIVIEWRQRPDHSLDLNVHHPAGLTPQINAYKNNPINTVTLTCD